MENITHKTGSAKKFPVFVKMLMTALGHGSESVFVDLLTYADLVSAIWQSFSLRVKTTNLLPLARESYNQKRPVLNIHPQDFFPDQLPHPLIWNSCAVQEQLKARRADAGGSGSPQHQPSQGVTATDTSNSNINGNKKRYLILTYVGEYDRVHYPLPLVCVEPPPKEPLERSADGFLRETGTVEGSPRESPAEAQLRAVSESSNN